jgi:replicative DNA helicase
MLLSESKEIQLFGRVPPQAKDLERAVLGAAMVERDGYDKISFLLPECFYLSAHVEIFKAYQRLSLKNQPIDLPMVCDELGDKLESVGGKWYVATLTNDVVNSANTEKHAKKILDKYLKRELIRICGEVINESYEDGDTDDILGSLATSLDKLRANTPEDYKSIEKLLFEAVSELETIRHRTESLTGITSGFRELDQVTCGWQNTDLIILAARPGVGKTAFMLNLARNAGCPVGVFSLEMSDRQLIQRMLSAESGVYMWNIRNGKIDDQQMKHIFEQGVRPLSTQPIFVDQTANIKLSVLKSRAKKMVEREGVKIIFVDYLQLVRVDSVNKGRKDLDIGDISSGLKGLAKELNIPVVCLSQLSRGVEARADGEPRLSDLRESGAIEQDADMVMFLWNPSDDDILKNPALSGVCNVKIEKHRNGTLETFLGEFKKETQKWTSVKVLDKSTFQPMGDSWKPYKED